jgi:hypothetical protein
MNMINRKDCPLMYVYNDERKTMAKRIVVTQFSDGSCLAVDNGYEHEFLNGDLSSYVHWSKCEPIPMRPMTFVESLKWWNDQVRSGNNPIIQDKTRRLHTSIPTDYEVYFACADYTGSCSDEWIKLEVEE